MNKEDSKIVKYEVLVTYKSGDSEVFSFENVDGYIARKTNALDNVLSSRFITINCIRTEKLFAVDKEDVRSLRFTKIEDVPEPKMQFVDNKEEAVTEEFRKMMETRDEIEGHPSHKKIGTLRIPLDVAFLLY